MNESVFKVAMEFRRRSITRTFWQSTNALAATEVIKLSLRIRSKSNCLNLTAKLQKELAECSKRAITVTQQHNQEHGPNTCLDVLRLKKIFRPGLY